MSSALFDLEAAESLWQDYAAAHPELARDSEPPVVDRFGGGGELTDRLLALVLDGPKRATATLVPEFEAEGQALPRIGSHWIACDSRGRPRAILRSTELRIGPFSTGDAAFAFDEGEGDRTLAWWRDAHREFWRPRCAELGIEWSEDIEVMFERFELVWRAEG